MMSFSCDMLLNVHKYIFCNPLSVISPMMVVLNPAANTCRKVVSLFPHHTANCIHQFGASVDSGPP